MKILAKKLLSATKINTSYAIVLPKKEYVTKFGVQQKEVFEATIFDNGTIMMKPIRPVEVKSEPET